MNLMGDPGENAAAQVKPHRDIAQRGDGGRADGRSATAAVTHARHGIQQGACIGLRRLGKQRSCGVFLDLAAGLHDDDARPDATPREQKDWRPRYAAPPTG